ncbi:hypothetical protein OS190_05445 [Sulfitobacter sp. F26204]|uniref:hypothetical protein n=1 Tax=Sulfitobacter sp. F26204 TaxID=2996014 RepID=UPI00225E6E99|nr:hypothetical protein [Sulfitobacter sp. F26204]MCX7559005.1 hypothetical protein [Sulfitobacter sp. F26204]
MMRILLSFCLMLVLVSTSHAAALAKGAAVATGQMVICNGNGTILVYTDADGAPTAAPLICPDCIANVALIEVPVIAKAPSRIVTLVISTALGAQLVPVSIRLGPQPRAPPVFA